MVFSKTTLLFIAGCLLPVVLAQDPSTVNWCQVQTDMCNGQGHIGCPTSVFPITPTSQVCTNVRLLPMNSTLKNLILDKHNAYRQQIASGSNTKFGAAQKLAVMEWDDTLQYLAEKHVSKCSFQHDYCRKTPLFPYSGQNLYYMGTAMQYQNASRAIDQGLAAWFDEWKIARAGAIDNLIFDDWQAFHFTVMVNDKNNKVGCGLIQYNYQSGSWLMDGFMLTCNYQYTNMLNQPMYTRGTPCSTCTCSALYPSLCIPASGANPTTAAPVTAAPTTAAPVTAAPTTAAPTTTQAPSTTTPASCGQQTTTTPPPPPTTTVKPSC